MTVQTIDFQPVTPSSDPDPIVGGRVKLPLLTTLKCNLKCTYCSLDVGDVLGSQTELKYDIDQITRCVETTSGARGSTSPTTAGRRRSTAP